MPGEPPTYPDTYFNNADYCLTNGIIRIGWPGVGDLTKQLDVPESTSCYGDIDSHIRIYLQEFRDIASGSVILMPDKDRSGVMYIGTTIGLYVYTYNIPRDPYECAHRIPVMWDRRAGAFAEYHSHRLALKTRGGFWTRAFHRIDRSQSPAVLEIIEKARKDHGR
jgi:hypothetical protein